MGKNKKQTSSPPVQSVTTNATTASNQPNNNPFTLPTTNTPFQFGTIGTSQQNQASSTSNPFKFDFTSNFNFGSGNNTSGSTTTSAAINKNRRKPTIGNKTFDDSEDDDSEDEWEDDDSEDDDNDEEYDDEDEYDEDEDIDLSDFQNLSEEKKLEIFQKLLMGKLGIKPKRTCPCCGEEDEDHDEEYEYEDDDDEYEEEEEKEEEKPLRDDEGDKIYKSKDSPFSRIFNLVREQVKQKEKQVNEKKKKMRKGGKGGGVLIEDITETSDPNVTMIHNPTDFFRGDFIEGIYETMKLENVQPTIEKTSVMICNDPCGNENSLYYLTLMNALRPLLHDVKKFITVQELRKKFKQPKLTIRPSTDLELMSDYFIYPNTTYLKRVLEKELVPKQQQKIDVLQRPDVVHSAKATLNSKQKKVEYLKKKFNGTNVRMTDELDTHNFGQTVDFENDPTDPELKDIKDDRLLERMKEYKTEGAYIKHIRIGNWSPPVCYDGQFRIKATIDKRLIYKFFTYVPPYHNNFINATQREKAFPLLKAVAHDESALSRIMLNEFEKFKVSHILSIEFPISHILRIHYQKLDTNKKVSAEQGLLVLVLAVEPCFLTRRVSCDDKERNRNVHRADFTNGQASTYAKHYIIGDDRELSRILAYMLLQNPKLKDIYNNGMNNISNQIGFSAKITDLQQKKEILDKFGIETTPPNLIKNRKDINKCFYINLNILHISTMEKLLSMNVKEMLNDVGLTVPGLTEQELENLKIYNTIKNEKFKEAGVYFSFCRGRFVSTSNFCHYEIASPCGSVKDPNNRGPNFDPKIPVRPSDPGSAFKSIYRSHENEVKKTEKYNELITDYPFPNIGSVLFYK